MAAEGGRIDFMFLGPPLTRPLDPLLDLHFHKIFELQELDKFKLTFRFTYKEIEN